MRTIAEICDMTNAEKRQRIEEVKDLLAYYTEAMTLMARGYTNNPTLKVKLVISEMSYVNNDNTYLQVGITEFECLLFEDEEIYNLLRFKVGHETQHILSTTVEFLQTIYSIVEMWKNEALNRNLATNTKFFQDTAHSLVNGIEDGRIENIMCNKFKGLIAPRKWYRMWEWSSDSNIITEEWNNLSAIMWNIHSIATRGLHLRGFLETFAETEVEETVENSLPLISKAVLSVTCKEGMENIYKIGEMITDYVLENLGDKKAQDDMSDMADELKSQNSEGQADEENEDKGNGLLIAVITDDTEFTDEEDEDAQTPDLIIDLRTKKEEEEKEDDENGNSSSSSSEDNENTENSEDAEDEDGANSNSSNEDNEEDTEEEDGANSNSSSEDDEEDTEDENGANSNSSSNSENGKDENSTTESSNFSSESISSENSKANSSNKDNDENNSKSNGFTEEDSKETKEDNSKEDNEKSSKADDNKTKTSNKEGGEFDATDTLGARQELSAEELKNIVKSIMENVAEELRQETETISKEATMEVERIRTARADNEKYSLTSTEKAELERKMGESWRDVDIAQETAGYSLSRGLRKKLELIKSDAFFVKQDIENIIKSIAGVDRQEVYEGDIDEDDIFKIAINHCDYFRQEGTPVENDMCCYILKDNSGSMDGPKQNISCETLALLEEIYKELMPLKLVAFDDGYGGLNHYIIKNWGDNDTNRNYALDFHNSYEADNGNDDEKSILIATAELEKRTEKDKLLVVISDGQPCGSNGRKGVQQAVQYAREKGIFVIGIYISEYMSDSSINNYEEMYGKDSICTHPSKIGEELLRVMQDYIISSS